MIKLFSTLFVCFAVVALVGTAYAQDEAAAEVAIEGEEATVAATIEASEPAFSLDFGKAFGAGLIIIGAALGIGRIGGQAVESMARQPEVAGNIQTAMLIAAALIEGATFFALIVCLL